MRREERNIYEHGNRSYGRHIQAHSMERKENWKVVLAVAGIALALVGGIAGTSLYYRQRSLSPRHANETVIYQQPVSGNGMAQGYSQGAAQQENREHTISAIVASAGGGTVSGGKQYADNTAATLTAIPDPHYRFTGWTENGIVVSTDSNYIFAVTGDRTLVANFEKQTYTIRFVDEDGTELQSVRTPYGEIPEYRGTTPEKSDTDQYTYTFAGWTSEICAATGDATYIAAYKRTEKADPVKNVGTPGLEITGSHLWDLKQIDDNGNTFYTLFSPEKSVIDYQGMVHKDENEETHEKTPLFLVGGDGQGECYRHAVTFINDKDYAFITGRIYLPNDADTLEKVKTGRITLVLVDANGRQLYKATELTSSCRETSFKLPIKGMKEFTLGVYSTDGRAGGDNMTMIVEGLELTE